MPLSAGARLGVYEVNALIGEGGKVRSDGAVKVLDFGLAKAMDPAGASGANAVNSPTLTAHATALGMIIGTAAYMAPEQAKGKAVDKRADIWAFGVVLYEMLGGRAAFAGDTVTDIIAAIVTREPDWTALPAATHASIRRLLARCLDKDPKRRVRDIGDVRFEIDEIIARGSSDARSPDSVSGPARLAVATRAWKLAWTVLWVAVGASLAAGLDWSGVWPRARPSESRPLRVSIVHTEGGEVGAPAISPDGRRVAYHRRTWALTSEGGQVLSWSDDGREILVATLSGHIAGYPVSTHGGFSHGEPTTLVRDVGSAAAYSSATRDHSRILIRVSPDTAKDKGEIRLLFGWQDALRQGKH